MGHQAVLVPVILTIQTVTKTFWPVVTSYVCVTETIVKVQANLHTWKSLGRISFVILTLGIAW